MPTFSDGTNVANYNSDLIGGVVLVNGRNEELSIPGQFLLDFISEWANYRIVKLEPREDGTSRL